MVSTSTRSMFTVSVSQGRSEVLITGSGKAGLSEICSALAFAGEMHRRSGLDKFLFDLLAVDFDGTVQDREEMGRYAATQLAGVRRIAVVLKDRDNTGDGERVARAAGLDLQNFRSIAEAKGWLDT